MKALKTMAAFAAVITLAIAIHLINGEPVKMIMACDGAESCVDLYGKPSRLWSARGAEDPSGHCRNGCTVKTVYDQFGDAQSKHWHDDLGDHNLIQEDAVKRPKWCGEPRMLCFSATESMIGH